MNKRLIGPLWILLFLICSQVIVAQSQKELRKERRENRKANTHKYRSPLIVYPVYWSMQDTRATPGIYRNLGLGLGVSRKIDGPKYNYDNNFQFNVGAGSPNFENGALMYTFAFLNEANYLRIMNDNLQLGGQLFISNHNRFLPALVNSSYNMDFLIGIGPAARWKSSINFLKKDTEIGISLAFPLVTNVTRIPKFGLSFNGISNTTAAIGRLNRISLRIDAKRLFKKSNENRINYFYKWDYYGMREFDGLHNLRIASHQIGFHLWIKRN